MTDYQISRDSKIQAVSLILSKHLEQSSMLIHAFDRYQLFIGEITGHFGMLPLFIFKTQELWPFIKNKNITLSHFPKNLRPQIKETLNSRQFKLAKEEVFSERYPISFVNDPWAYCDSSVLFNRNIAPQTFLKILYGIFLVFKQEKGNMVGTTEQIKLFGEKVITYDKLLEVWKKNKPEVKDFDEVFYDIERKELECRVSVNIPHNKLRKTIIKI